MTEYFLITGASKGIGFELAHVLGISSKNLILVARDKDALEQLAQTLIHKYSIKVEVIDLDLSQPHAAQKLYQEVKTRSLQVEGLINNAGFGLHGEFLKYPLNEVTQMLQLNMVTLTETCHLFGNDMAKAGGGKILNIASTAAFQPGPFFSTYYASKAYVLSFSEALYSELKNKGVSVSVVCPGPTETHFQSRAGAHDIFIFRKFFMMSARQVAEQAWLAMRQGKRLHITGVTNKLGAFLTRIFPRSLVLCISKKIVTGQENGH